MRPRRPRRRSTRSPPRHPLLLRRPPAGGVDIVAELTKLASLKDAGILSDAEFAAAKAKLLG